MSTSSDDFSSPDIHKRLSVALGAIGVSQKEFAKKVDVAQSYVSDLCRGSKKPGAKILVGLTEHYGISASWILCGREPMFLPKTVKEAATAVVAQGQAVLEAAARLSGPSSPSDLEAMVGELVDVPLNDAATRLRRDVLELLREATTAAPHHDPHPLHALVDRLVTECPDQVPMVEAMLGAAVKRCAEPEKKTA